MLIKPLRCKPAALGFKTKRVKTLVD